MICLMCRQAQVFDSLTSVSFQRGEIYLMINNVPAFVCPGCGEAYVDDEVTLQLLRMANEMSQAGKLNGACEYARAKC